MVLHSEGRKTGIILHGVYYLFFIIQNCHALFFDSACFETIVTLLNTKQLKLDNPVF